MCAACCFLHFSMARGTSVEAYVLTKDDVEFLRGALTTLRNTSVNPMQLPSDTLSYDQATSTYLVLTPPGGIGRATAGTAPNSLATPTYASCQVVQQNGTLIPPQLFLVPGFTVPVWNYNLQEDIPGSRVVLVVQNSFGEWVPCTLPPGASGGAYIALTPIGGIPAGFYPDGMGTGTGSGTGTGTGCIGHAEHFTTGQATCSIFKIINVPVGNLRPVGISEVVYNTSTAAIPGCTLITVVQDKYGYWLAVPPKGSVQTIYYEVAGTYTWTKPTGLVAVEVEVVGGGGGGGGTDNCTAGQSAAAGGGGSGGYSLRRIFTSSLGSTETVTVGARGAGGAIGNGGSSGGTSSFGSWLSATGGGGADRGVASDIQADNFTTQFSSPGASGKGLGGDINGCGVEGFPGLLTPQAFNHLSTITLQPYCEGGRGGDSPRFGGNTWGQEATGYGTGAAQGTDADNGTTPYGAAGGGSVNAADVGSGSSGAEGAMGSVV